MSEQIYTIKYESLVELFDKLREANGFSNVGEKELFSLDQAKFLLEKAGENRRDYIALLNKASGSTLFIPREIETISGSFLQKQFPWVEYLKWEQPRQDLILQNDAFYKSNLISVEIPEETSSMGSSVFSGSSNLKKVEWNSSKMKTIEAESFEDCIKLEEVFFSEEAANNIVRIGASAFKLGKSSSTVNLKMNFNNFINLTSLGMNAFYGSNLSLIDNMGDPISRLIIPRGLVDLPSYAFANCKFTEVFFPNTYLGTEKGTFIFYSTPLKVVEFESGLTNLTIPGTCFEYCPLETIINSDCISILGNSSFYGAGTTDSSIEEFKNVEELGYKCFGNAYFSALSFPKLNRIKGVSGATENFYNSKIKTLTFGTDFGTEKREEGVSYDTSYYYITDSFFKGSNIDTIKFLGTIEEWCSRIIAPINKEREDWSGWPFAKTITNGDGTTSGGRLFVYNKDNELVEFKGTSTSPFKIDVETIEANVFANYKNFGYVEFSDKLKTIKENAFKNITTTTGKDEIYFNMHPYQYLELEFENEFSSPYGQNVPINTVKARNINGGNKLNMASLKDNMFKKYDENGIAQFQTNITIPANAYAYIVSGTIDLGNSYYFPNGEMEKIIIGEKAFYKSGIGNAAFGIAQQVIIGNQAFYGDEKISGLKGDTSLESYPNIIEIGIESFYNCIKLVHTRSSAYPFTLPIIKTIGDRAFYGCTQLTEIVLGSENNPVESIGADAFSQCTGITKATIYYDNSLYTEDTFNTMPNYPWGLTEATIEGIGTTKANMEG